MAVWVNGWSVVTSLGDSLLEVMLVSWFRLVDSVGCVVGWFNWLCSLTGLWVSLIGCGVSLINLFCFG